MIILKFLDNIWALFSEVIIMIITAYSYAIEPHVHLLILFITALSKTKNLKMILDITKQMILELTTNIKLENLSIIKYMEI